MKLRFRFLFGAATLLAGMLALSGCPSAEQPTELFAKYAELDREDYAVFAQRCSKCHSLSRPLNSGIDDDEYWVLYVAKMRRQPESGISPEDSKEILRFLHKYSLEQRRRKARAAAADLAAPDALEAPDAQAADAGGR